MDNEHDIILSPVVRQQSFNYSIAITEKPTSGKSKLAGHKL